MRTCLRRPPRGVFLGALLVGMLSAVEPARAAGPIERLVQLLAHPTDPNVLAVRYGVASHGFLFTRDGGRSFRAMCSQAVAPELQGIDKLDKISFNQIAATAAVVIDGGGRITLARNGSSWSDDGTGCAWSRVPELEGKWPQSVKVDPRDNGVIWAAVTTMTGERENIQTTANLMRRTDDGAWSTIGPIKTLSMGQMVLDARLAVFADATRRRHYVSMNLVSYGLSSQWYVLVSDDEGRSWREHTLPGGQERLNVLTVDPTDPDRVLAAIPSDDADVLLLSADQGATFMPYAELRAISDVSFDAQGRIFIADAGDSSSTGAGGLYTATTLGDPLSRIGDTQYVDCAQYNAQTSKLYMCSRDRFGVVNPETGELDELVRLDAVPDLLDCPDRDMYIDCSTQLNDGPSWCCAGHYPFTPFCAEYNVTMAPDGRRVFCGLAGREYDRPADAGPSGGDAGGEDLDASTRADGSTGTMDDAGSPVRDAAVSPGAGRRSNKGCAVVPDRSGSSTLLWMATIVSVLALLRSRRRLTSRLRTLGAGASPQGH